MERKKIFVAMSGGVDSSVAALLLKNQGHNVIGVFLRCYNVDGCAERDSEDARRVAEKIGVPFYVWDFEEEYKKRVVDYMVQGYKQGITPNPDVMCNKEIKFGLFFERALATGADYVATGHYVRLAEVEPSKRDYKKPPIVNYKLFSARDKNKDQSYFLWTLTQENLRYCLFPVGGYLKPEVREIARKAGLPTAEKKDSQGICFLGKVTLSEFLAQYLPEKRGAVLTTVGQRIGEHSGIQFYTVGQRHIGLSGNHPFYVVEKKVTDNELIVAEANDSALSNKETELKNVNFINAEYRDDLQDKKISVLARVRYRQPLAEAILSMEDKKIRLIFAEPQKFVAPGQSAVFYSIEGELLGGGIVDGPQSFKRI